MGKGNHRSHYVRKAPYGYESETRRARRRKESPRQHSPTPPFDSPVWIDPHRGTESERLDLGACLVKIIVSFGGTMSLSCLDNELLKEYNWKCVNPEGLREFIDDFKDVFVLNEDGQLGKDTITCEPFLDICPTHIQKEGSCFKNCGSLHICKFHLLSDCDINNCKFGHDLKDLHNSMVLIERMLSRLDFWEIKKIFRNLSNRYGITIPSVCTYYNAKGCGKRSFGEYDSSSCPFLHICQHYVDGDCKFGMICKRSHNIFDNQPKELLRKYGLQNEPSDRLLWLLKKPKRTANSLTRLQMTRSADDIPLRRNIITNRSRFEYKEGKDNTGTSQTDDTRSKRSCDSDEKTVWTSQTDDTRSKRSCDSYEKTVWTFMEHGHTIAKDISESERNRMEQKYQQYLEAKDHYVTIGDTVYKVDFSRMEGSPYGTDDMPGIQLTRSSENVPSMFL